MALADSFVFFHVCPKIVFVKLVSYGSRWQLCVLPCLSQDCIREAGQLWQSVTALCSSMSVPRLYSWSWSVMAVGDSFVFFHVCPKIVFVKLVSYGSRWQLCVLPCLSQDCIREAGQLWQSVTALCSSMSVPRLYSWSWSVMAVGDSFVFFHVCPKIVFVKLVSYGSRWQLCVLPCLSQDCIREAGQLWQSVTALCSSMSVPRLYSWSWSVMAVGDSFVFFHVCPKIVFVKLVSYGSRWQLYVLPCLSQDCIREAGQLWQSVTALCSSTSVQDCVRETAELWPSLGRDNGGVCRPLPCGQTATEVGKCIGRGLQGPHRWLPPLRHYGNPWLFLTCTRIYWFCWCTDMYRHVSSRLTAPPFDVRSDKSVRWSPWAR